MPCAMTNRAGADATVAQLPDRTLAGFTKPNSCIDANEAGSDGTSCIESRKTTSYH